MSESKTAKAKPGPKPAAKPTPKPNATRDLIAARLGAERALEVIPDVG